MTTLSTKSSARDLTVVGFYASGTPFSGTVNAASPHEAKIHVLADRRYSEDGGDFCVSCVIDEATGKVVDEDSSASETLLLSEVDAVENLLQQMKSIVQDPKQIILPEGTCLQKVGAFIQFFDHLLADQPDVFSDLAGGGRLIMDEDMEITFVDRKGAEHDFVPSEALGRLADLALQRQSSTAAVQLKSLVQAAGSNFDLAVHEAYGEY